MWNPSSSAVDDNTSPRSSSPSPTNEGSYQDVYDDPRPSAPRRSGYAQSPSEEASFPDLSVRAYVGARMSTMALAKEPDGSRLVIAGKDTLRILRIEDAESQPADAVDTPGRRSSRSYAAAAASDAVGGAVAPRHIPKSRRMAKSLSRYSGPHESAVYEDTNLWAGAGSKLGFQSSIVDVEWSHQDFNNTIITAFGAGELATWDLNKASNPKLDRSVRDAHIRAIHCIRISPIKGSALLTASQDGYVKYWDLRSFKAPVLQIPHPGTSVRSLSFSPCPDSAQQILVGQEIGVLLRSDDIIQKTKQPLDRLLTAHSSAILSIDWKHVGNENTTGYAATGGMDKTVKVWDMSSPQIPFQPVHTLHTTHPIKQVAWRPGHETELAIAYMTPGIAAQKGVGLSGTTSLIGIDMSLQIHAHGAKTPMLSSSPASHYAFRGPHHRQRALSHSESIVTSSSSENLAQIAASHTSQNSAYDGDADRIEIWDIRRSWVAKYVIGDGVADGAATELVWPNPTDRPGSALWVAYANGTFAQHDIRNVFRPLDTIPRSGITWETRGVVAFAVDAVERGEIPYDDVRPDAKLLFASRGGKDKSVTDPTYVPQTQVKGSLPIPSFELGIFVKLARGYILEGTSRDEICLHNSRVALEAGQYRAAQTWHTLRGLLAPLVPEGPALPNTDTINESHSSRSYPVHLPSAHTPSPHLNQSGHTRSGPNHNSLAHELQSPRRNYTPGRSRRPTTTRHASRGSGSGSGRSRATTRSRSVSVDSGSSLKHVGGGALEDESDSSDGDIAGSESEGVRSSSKVASPIAASGSRGYLPLSRRRTGDRVNTPILTAFNEADEHNLSLVGGESSDEQLPTDSEPLNNSPTSDVEASETEADTEPEMSDLNGTSLATLRPETANFRRLLRRQDSRSSVGTAKPPSLNLDDPKSVRKVHKQLESGDGRRPSPVVSSQSLKADKSRVIADPTNNLRSRKSDRALFADRGRSRKTRREVCEAEAGYRQMGWEAMRETVEYYSERGELQTSAMLSAVAGKDLGISFEAHERLVDAYLDVLSRLRLYAPAAYVRKYALSKTSRQETTLNTIIYSACSRCSKALVTGDPTDSQLNGHYGFCAKCQQAASKCSICRLPVRGLYVMCLECSHGGHQECYRAYYLSRPLANIGGSSSAANSRTNTILESETRSEALSVASLTVDTEKGDDASSIKTEKTSDTLITDPSNRNSLELPAQDGKGSTDWFPQGHPCAAGCGHFCWVSNDRITPETQ